MSNVYSALLDILRRSEGGGSPVLFGTVTAYDPIAVRVQETEVCGELLYPRGTRYDEKDLGREVALLPCTEGLLLLFQVEGGTA